MNHKIIYFILVSLILLSLISQLKTLRVNELQKKVILLEEKIEKLEKKQEELQNAKS